MLLPVQQRLRSLYPCASPTKTQLQSEVRDTIIQKWTIDGQCSTHSAYRIQFKGIYGRHEVNLIWKTHVENKYKKITWTLIQDIILAPQQDTCYVQWTSETSHHHHLCLLCPSKLFGARSLRGNWKAYNLGNSSDPRTSQPLVGTRKEHGTTRPT